ncbi:2-hydroxyacid dehydrogenase [Priestia filamentosa]|uniref:2-hydroxyacid dehydrogenase n=1 Tax=Priestia filamentosa TaxID=1402861 RepID=UPI001C1E2744|nr:2-hydroxyacid dehydrogenase [Priestia filamentosa]WCM17737.1 2-hydroxyacid dehydrogenase [Priestia filamentosa]
MKLLAIGDALIPADIMEEGLSSLSLYGIEVEVREWKHNSVEALQKDNLLVEGNGPEAITVEKELFDGIETFDAIVVQFTPLSKEILQRGKKLKLIGVLRGGTENVDHTEAKALGISVLNTPGRNARAVAEFTLGMILSEVRNIARSHEALKKGKWEKDFPNGEEIPELNEKKVGIVGYGNIGRLLGSYLHALGCELLIYDEYTHNIPYYSKKVSLDELLEQADIVSLHLRLTEETHHFIGQKEIEKMKETAVLINTARSGLIDEEALVQSLQEKKIMGAALDVFDHEPLPYDDKLLQLENVTITPHLAGSTIDAFRQSPKKMAEYIVEWMKAR